jgi:hypothetical protein
MSSRSPKDPTSTPELLAIVGGGLLVVSGAYLVAYWAPTLTHVGSPTRPPALVGFGTALSARLTSLLLAGRGPVAVLAGVLVASGPALTIRRRHQSTRRPDPATYRAQGGGGSKPVSLLVQPRQKEQQGSDT